MTSIVARHLGVMFEPPTVTLIYSIEGKLRTPRTGHAKP